MDVFVGAEYVLAIALIALKKKGIDRIRVATLHAFGIRVQKLCIEKSVGAVILLSNVYAAIYNYSDYFAYDDEGSEPFILLKDSASIHDLERRFVGYLPLAILKVILETAETLAAA
jgi:hypothetical protein